MNIIELFRDMPAVQQLPKVPGHLSVIAARHCFAAALCVVLAPRVQAQSGRRVYDQHVNGSLRLQVTVTNPEPDAGGCCRTVALVSFVDASRSWDIARITEEYEMAFVVARADANSLVLLRSDPDYGIRHESIKLFFDSSAKRLVKRIDFDSSREAIFSNDAEAARVLGVTRDVAQQLRRRNVFSSRPADLPLPAVFDGHPLPQSTYQEFAHTRPSRVKDGYSAGSARIEEAIGAFQRDGDRFWIAKTFYDGEGLTGVGAVGSLDRAGKYEFLRIPALYDWSVRGLLVEPDTIWAGRVAHPEGADRSGGLLQYERRSERVTVHEVPDAIHSLARSGDALFAGTDNGVYVISNGRRTRYRAEPDITGRFIIVEENLTGEGKLVW